MADFLTFMEITGHFFGADFSTRRAVKETENRVEGFVSTEAGFFRSEGAGRTGGFIVAWMRDWMGAIVSSGTRVVTLGDLSATRDGWMDD